MATAKQTTYAQSILPSWYTNYAQSVLANQQAISNKPYTPYPDARLAGFNEDQTTGFDMTRAAAGAYEPTLDTATASTAGALGRSTLGAAAPWINQASGMSSLGAAAPGLNTAGALSMASTTPMGWNAALPFLNAAGERTTDVSAYMNPYTDSVVNRIGALGARTLSEQLIPSIQDAMVRAGQFGGSRQAELFGRGLRDTYESTLAEQDRALEAGYGQAQNVAQNDAQRFGALAGTAGNLGTAQQGALSTAAGQTADIAKTAGALTGQDQSAIMNLAQQIAQMYGQDTANQLLASGQLAQMAQQQQNQGLAGASAVTGVGNAEQAQEQKNLDIAYQNFLTQQGYPQAQIDQMLKAIGGTSPAVPASQISYQNSKAPSASALSTVTGLALTAAGSGALGGT